MLFFVFDFYFVGGIWVVGEVGFLLIVGEGRGLCEWGVVGR